MKIIIAGAGSVGSAICRELVAEGHAITVLDRSEGAISELSNQYDVTGVVGVCTDLVALREAGAERADLLIAITDSDEINLLCCFAARKLGVKHTAARVRNPEYASLTELTSADMGLGLVINPELYAARTISRVLRLPSATRVDTFCDGRVETIELTVSEDSPIAGKSLYKLREELGVSFLICGIKRDGEVFIPNGSTEILHKDIICVTTAVDDTVKFLKATKSYKRPVKNLMILGGGRTTYYLCDLLRRTKTDITVIEKDSEVCRGLSLDHGVTVINGDGMRQELLIEEGIERADAFISLSSVDEENAISSMFAANMNVPVVITMISSLSYVSFFERAGLDNIVSPKHSTVGQILKFVRGMAYSRGSEIRAIHHMMAGALESLEFNVTEPIEGVTDIPIKDIVRRDDVLIACIVRGKEIIIPSGIDSILVGDSVIVVAKGTTLNSIKDILK